MIELPVAKTGDVNRHKYRSFGRLWELIGRLQPDLLDLHEDMPEFFRDRFQAPLLRPFLPVVTGVARASAAVASVPI